MYNRIHTHVFNKCQKRLINALDTSTKLWPNDYGRLSAFMIVAEPCIEQLHIEKNEK